AAGVVRLELATLAPDRERLAGGSVAGGEPPDVSAVPGPAARIRNGVAPLRQCRPARVLEVIDALVPHVVVGDIAEVDPDVRVLVAEQRRELDEALSVVRAPLIAAHPLVPCGGISGMRRRAEGQDVENHSLVVADPVGVDEAAFRMPAHA